MSAYADGNILTGGFTVTFDISGLTVIVDTANPQLPTKVIQRTDENDAPAAQYVYDDWITASLTVQINAFANQIDLRGDTFTSDKLTGAAKKFVVVTQSAALPKGERVTFDLTVNEVIN